MELDVGREGEKSQTSGVSHTVIFRYETEEPENPQPKPDLPGVMKVYQPV